ncbi:MAG: hypothetical protein GC179_29970 [Anaerolineaceae bacterium]|nr:hypothetical protein [Anaerolineaceae bacterium]
MSTDEMRLFVRRYDDMFNKPDITIADEIFAQTFRAHFPLTPTLNRATYKTFIDSFYGAFPDFVMQICDTISAQDRLVLRVTYFGTHKGDFMGIPATGCEVIMPAISIFRVENEAVVENWTEMDIIGALQQISAKNCC